MDKLKKYLKEDINQEEFDKDIKELRENIVKDYFVGLNKSQASKLLEDIPSLKSAHDSLTNKAVDSFRDNTLPEMLEEKVNEKMKELNPPETAEQKRIRELENQMKKRDEEYSRERRINHAYSLAKEVEKETGMKMTDRQIQRYVGNTDEETKQNFEEFKEDYNSPLQSAVETEIAKRFKGEPPKGGDSPEKNANEYTEEELANMAKTNPAKLDEIINKQTERASVK